MDTHTHTYTYTHDNYYNPHCAHAHRGSGREHDLTNLKQTVTECAEVFYPIDIEIPTSSKLLILYECMPNAIKCLRNTCKCLVQPCECLGSRPGGVASPDREWAACREFKEAETCSP